MPYRRPLLKRIALWTGAVVLLLAWYLAGAPFVAVASDRYLPAATPILAVVYSPLVYVTGRPDRPGSGFEFYRQYLRWCYKTLG
jgi:hypothetical protein